MNAIHVTIHRRPVGVVAGPVETIGGARLSTLHVPSPGIDAGLPLAFDDAVARLAALPRMFVEPDGSFVWVAQSPPLWQLEGMLWDRGAKLSHVELKGTCTSAELARLLAVLGLDPRDLIIQSVPDGLYFDAPTFLKLGGLAGPDSAERGNP